MTASEALDVTRSWEVDLRAEKQRMLNEDGDRRLARVNAHTGATEGGDDEEDDMEDVIASAEHIMSRFFED